jgi:tRNA uridine 5-carboxymethylaminomethyl modification enzyme
MNGPANAYDAVVVGAGHAGIEAAMAIARLGFRTLMITQNLDTIGKLSCNPAVGGLAKGNMVREIDALGGQMGKIIDETMIQFRVLNRSRGPAVQAPRAQADKLAYQVKAKQVLESEPNLSLFQDTVVDLLYRDAEGRLCRGDNSRGADPGDGAPGAGVAPVPGSDPAAAPPADPIDAPLSPALASLPVIDPATAAAIGGVVTARGKFFTARTVVVTTGTFLNGRIFIGEYHASNGRIAEPAAHGLERPLKALGFVMGRMKTGTPARVMRRSIDFSRVEAQFGDEAIVPFSYSNPSVDREQVQCYITYSTEETHRIIEANMSRSPLYSGLIVGSGPRYCPSIEDKVVKFPDRTRHQIFIEPEGLSTDEMYLNGISTSLPEDVQEAFIHSIPGLEHAEIVRPGYAVEYDHIDPVPALPDPRSQAPRRPLHRGADQRHFRVRGGGRAGSRRRHQRRPLDARGGAVHPEPRRRVHRGHDRRPRYPRHPRTVPHVHLPGRTPHEPASRLVGHAPLRARLAPRPALR